MVVEATITDADAYRSYMEALVASNLFQRFGGIPLATGKVHEILEGDYDAGEIVALVEFPSSAKAHAFWNCPEYRDIAKRRENAGRFKVGLWRKFGTA